MIKSNIDDKNDDALKAHERNLGANPFASGKNTGASSLQSSSLIEKHPLSGVSVRTSFKPLASTSEFRKYVGSVESRVELFGNIDCANTGNIFEVGARSLVATEIFARASVMYEAQQSVRTSLIQAVQLIELHKRYSNFSGTFEFMDLSAILYMLGKSVAFYCNTKTLTCDMIRNGAPISILPLSRSVDPINTSNHSLFLPRDAGVAASRGSFYAIAASANAYGTTVYTDVLTVNGDGGVIMSEPTGVDLALSCLHAARIIMSMYNDISEGSVAALAFTRGIHSAITVVAHSDEGGYMRRVLRRCGYVRPYGGIYAPNALNFVGLPVAGTPTPSVICGIIDAIALVSAAEVAVSAPVVTTNGGLFPMVFTGKADKSVGENERFETDVNLTYMATTIARNSYQFSYTYVERLSKMFGMSTCESNTQLAATALQTCFESLIDRGDRHLMFETVAPFFWIEPTGLIQNKPDTAAQRAGYGVLSCPNQPGKIPMFEEPELVKDQGFTYQFMYKHRSARTSGWLTHCGYHKLDGLASIKPAQYAAARFVMNKDDARTLRDNRAGFDEYMWQRGQSRLPHPAESMYVNSVKMVCHALAGQFDMDTFAVANNHVPDAKDLTKDVTFYASTLRELGFGRSNAVPKYMARARAEGIIVLENCRSNWQSGIMANEGTLLFGEYDGPVLVNLGDREHVQPDDQNEFKFASRPECENTAGPPLPKEYTGNPGSHRPTQGKVPKVGNMTLSSEPENTLMLEASASNEVEGAHAQNNTVITNDPPVGPATAEANQPTGTGDLSLPKAPNQ